jgi:hypothetical protein
MEGSTGAVRFAGSSTQELAFAGSGAIRKITIDSFGTPVSAISGTQSIEAVIVTNPYGPVRLSGSAVASMKDTVISGAPGVGSDVRACLARISGSAQLTMRGLSRITGSFRCDYANEPPTSSALCASESSRVDMEDTQISGDIANAALFVEGATSMNLKNVAISFSTACYGASSTDIRGSANVSVSGGSYGAYFAVGVVENDGRPNVTIDGGTFADFGWWWRGYLKVRNATFSRHISVNAPVDGTTVDFGTSESPGKNHFQDGTSPNPEQFLVMNRGSSGTLSVDASGNFWIPNEQGTTASGRYAVGTTTTSYPAQGRNFTMVDGSALRF